MKKSRRILSIILAIMMIITAVPLTASAQTYSGTCGENLTWEFDESTGTLTISGTGAMDNYDGDVDCPWRSFSYDILKVVIEDGVTTIGNAAFLEFYDTVRCFYLGKDIESIGDYAFAGNETLGGINFPDGLKTIGDYAFACCDESPIVADFPDSLISIGDYAFYYTPCLVPSLPENLQSVGDFAFWKSVFCGEVKIPASLTDIGEKAFSEMLGFLKFEEGCEITGNWNSTFAKSQWYNIEFPEGIESICTNSFYGSYIYTLNIPETVTEIEDGAFYNCFIRRINYAGDEESWNKIVVGADNESLLNAEINYMASFTEEDYSGYCGENVTYNFNPDTGELIISGTGPMFDYEYDPSYLYAPWKEFANNIKKIIIKDGVTTIGTGAFTMCTNLKDIFIADSVTSIGCGAFAYCCSLENIVIPDNVTVINSETFVCCFKLENIELPDNLTSIGDVAFAYCCSLKHLTIPDGVKSIGEAALMCLGLRSITFADSIEEIDVYLFLYNVLCEDIYFKGSEDDWNKLIGPVDELFWYMPCVIVHFCDHIFSEWETISDVTCIQDGVQTRFCSKCGKNEKEVTDAYGHSFGEWMVTVAPTVTKEGQEARYCDICGEEETRTIPSLYLVGDVNRDGKISAIDARLILQITAELIEYDDEYFELADVNGDGRISSLDARIVLMIVSGLA